MHCDHCRREATARIPSIPGDVCGAHAIEFWTGLMAYAKKIVRRVCGRRASRRDRLPGLGVPDSRCDPIDLFPTFLRRAPHPFLPSPPTADSGIPSPEPRSHLSVFCMEQLSAREERKVAA